MSGETTSAVLDVRDPAGSASPGPPGPTPPEPARPDLLDLPAAGERWWVLHTLSRCEKKVARACERIGIRHYLPLREHRANAHRRRVHEVPLFPGYIFACFGPSARDPLLESGAIARVIPVPHLASLLDELRQIRAALAAGADLVAEPALGRGMLVRVASGLLSGVVGRVAWVKRHRIRLVLNVTMLGRGAEVEVDAEAVLPIGAPPSGEARSAHGVGRRPWRVCRGRVVRDSLAGAV